MRQRFEELIKGRAAAVRKLIAVDENLEFECKVKADPTTGSPWKGDKEILGKALSAFANSTGGLLLWGVDARENSVTGIDSIVDFKPISEIYRFKSEMARLCVEALMPRHPGIFVEAIEDESPNSSAGFLAIYVERSERRPHRCEFGNKYYYRRAGASSRQMEHFEIEDAFRRLMVPVLRANYRPSLAGSSGDGLTFIFTLRLEFELLNESSVSARFPYLSVKPNSRTRADQYINIQGTIETKRNDWIFFEATMDYVIHPDVSKLIGTVLIDVPATRNLGSFFVDRRFIPGQIATRLGAYDSPMCEQVIFLDPDELIRVIPAAYLT